MLQFESRCLHLISGHKNPHIRRLPPTHQPWALESNWNGRKSLSVSDSFRWIQTLSMEQTVRHGANLGGGANDSVVVPQASPQLRTEDLQGSKASPAARPRRQPMRWE